MDEYDRYERRPGRRSEPYNPRWAGTFGTNPDTGHSYGQEGYGGAPYERGYDYDEGRYLDEHVDEEDEDFAEAPYEGSFGLEEDPTGRPSRLWRQNGPNRQHRHDPRPQGPYQGIGPRNYRRSDERLHDEACYRLTQHGQVDASDVEVEVKDGEVTLNGVVNTRQEKYMAEDALETITGVRDIHNHLRVRTRNR